MSIFEEPQIEGKYDSNSDKEDVNKEYIKVDKMLDKEDDKEENNFW